MKYILLPFICYCLLILITYILLKKIKEDYQKFIKTEIKLSSEMKEAIYNSDISNDEFAEIIKRNTIKI